MQRLFALGTLLFFLSCDEQKEPIEPFTPPEGERVILIEEFTGIGCTNCPKGSREIESLLTQYPDNLVAVSIHAGFFSDTSTFSFGKYDFRTEEGAALYNYIGAPLGYPSASINRTPVAGDLQLSLNQWSSAINRDIQVDPAVEILLDVSYDAGSRLLVVNTSTVAKENISGDLRLSIMLTESGIVDAQDDLEFGGINYNYVHNHVLRDMLTPATGETLSNSVMTGQVLPKSYSVTLPAQWVAENMEVIAFVSSDNANGIPVLQAAHSHVIE